MSPELPTRPDSTAQLNGAVDISQSVAAVQELVKEYNDSGNPGKFTVLTDGKYLHVQQIERTLNGQSQPFEPVSNTVVNWNSESKSRQQVLVDLFAALQQHGVHVVEGVGPMGSLLMHPCKVEGNSLTAGQILGAVLDGLNTNTVSGQKSSSYIWHLVYDPNWQKYFLNFYLVGRDSSTMASEPSKPNAVTAQPQATHGSSRLGAFTGSKPQN